MMRRARRANRPANRLERHAARRLVFSAQHACALFARIAHIASQERATAPLKHYQRTATGARTSFHVGLHLLAPHPSFYRLG